MGISNKLCMARQADSWTNRESEWASKFLGIGFVDGATALPIDTKESDLESDDFQLMQSTSTLTFSQTDASIESPTETEVELDIESDVVASDESDTAESDPGKETAADPSDLNWANWDAKPKLDRSALNYLLSTDEDQNELIKLCSWLDLGIGYGNDE